MPDAKQRQAAAKAAAINLGEEQAAAALIRLGGIRSRLQKDLEGATDDLDRTMAGLIERVGDRMTLDQIGHLAGLSGKQVVHGRMKALARKREAGT